MIMCDENGITVVSAGRDKQPGTKDDIKVPNDADNRS